MENTLYDLYTLASTLDSMNKIPDSMKKYEIMLEMVREGK